MKLFREMNDRRDRENIIAIYGVPESASTQSKEGTDND